MHKDQEYILIDLLALKKMRINGNELSWKFNKLKETFKKN